MIRPGIESGSVVRIEPHRNVSHLQIRHIPGVSVLQLGEKAFTDPQAFLKSSVHQEHSD